MITLRLKAFFFLCVTGLFALPLVPLVILGYIMEDGVVRAIVAFTEFLSPPMAWASKHYAKAKARLKTAVAEKRYWENRRLFMGLLIMLSVLIATVSACTPTVTPSPVSATQASFDGAEQTSGILFAAPGGYVITGEARDRYNALVSAYGPKFIPPLVPDAGITPYAEGHYFITNAALVDFLTMNQWHRMGR